MNYYCQQIYYIESI